MAEVMRASSDGDDSGVVMAITDGVVMIDTVMGHLSGLYSLHNG